MSSLIGLQLWSSRWHYFHKSTEQGGVGGESEKTPCSMNVQKFSTVFWLAKELCCKGWLCFVPCLTFPHNQTISAFLYLYNPIQPVAFYIFTTPFSLSQRYLLSLAKEQIDNTAAFSPSQRKTWRSRVFSLLKELDIFLSSQGKGDFSHFTFFPCTQRSMREKRGKSPQAAFEESAMEFEKAFQCLIPTLRLCEGKVEAFQNSSSFPDSRKEKSDGQKARNTQNIFDKSM